MAPLMKLFVSHAPFRSRVSLLWNCRISSRSIQNILCKSEEVEKDRSRKTISLLDIPRTENEYMHQLLASNKLYGKSIAFMDFLREECSEDVDSILNNEVDNVPAYYLTLRLKRILEKCGEMPDIMRCSKVAQICEKLGENLNQLADEHLCNLMKILYLWPTALQDQRFFDLCKSIDKECVQRLPNWGYNSILLTADHFYRLSPQQVVHAMFLVNVIRKWSPAVQMTDVELIIMDYMFELSVEEVGILAIGFFKSQKSMVNINVIEKMYVKLLRKIDEVNSYTLSSYLKFFRLSTPICLKHKMLELLSALSGRLNDLPITCCTHAVLLGTDKLIYHPESMKKVVERFSNNLRAARLKDMERLVYALQKFNFESNPSDDIYKKIMEELHNRHKEIEEFPKVFLRTLHYLALKGYFDYDLINEGLSPSFLKSTFQSMNKFSIPADVLHISMSMELECPDYRGNVLNSLLTNELVKYLAIKNMPDERKRPTTSTAFLVSIKNAACQLFKNTVYVHMVYILPYFSKPDIIFCLKDGQPVPLPQNIRDMMYLDRENLRDIEGTWYAFISMDKYATIDTSDEPIGPINAKIRQLKILGFEPILVRNSLWTCLDSDKPTILRKLVYAF